MKLLIQLLDCIRHLGLRNGWRYFKISIACERDPEMIKQWAQNCREAAANEPDVEVALMFIQFADGLEKLSTSGKTER